MNRERLTFAGGTKAAQKGRRELASLRSAVVLQTLCKEERVAAVSHKLLCFALLSSTKFFLSQSPLDFRRGERKKEKEKEFSKLFSNNRIALITTHSPSLCLATPV